MAGSATITYQRVRSVREIIWDWTSDGSGDVSGVGETDGKDSGVILEIRTDPDGTDAPSDNYDIVVNDIDVIDVAQGFCANRDTADVERVTPVEESTVGENNYGNLIPFTGVLDLVVSNAGSAKKGQVRLLFR